MPKHRSKRRDDVDQTETRRLRKRRNLLTIGTIVVVLAVLAAGGLWWRAARYERKLAHDREVGYAALEAGDYAKALNNIGPWLGTHEDDADAIFAYARAREQVEEPRDHHLGEAIVWYRKIGSQFPGHPKALEAEPRMLALMVRLEMWNAILNETESIRPETVQANDERALRNLRSRAAALSRVGRSADAIEALRAYVALRPLDTDMQVMLLALEVAGGERGAANQRVAALREAYPDDPRSLVTAASLAGIVGDAPQAAHLATDAMTRLLGAADGGVGLVQAEENDGFVTRLVAALDAGGKPEAANDALAALASDAGSIRLKRYAANRLLQTARYEAVLVMTADLDLWTGDGELLGLRGIGLKETGKGDEAMTIAEALAGREEGSRGWSFAKVIPWWRPTSSVLLTSTPVTAVHDATRRIEAAQAALESYNHPVFRVVLAEGLSDADEPYAAIVAFARASAVSGNVWDRPLLQLALTAVSVDQTREASAALATITQRGARNTEAASAVITLVASRDNPAIARPLLEKYEDDDSPWLDLARATTSGDWSKVDPTEFPAGALPGIFDLAIRTGASEALADITQSASERASRGELDPNTVALMVALAQGDSAAAPSAPALDADAAEFVKDLLLLARSDRSKAATVLREALDDAIAQQSGEETAHSRLVQLSRAAWDLNLLATSETGDWQRLRQTAAAMSTAIGEEGERWITRQALLDLNPPNRAVDEAQLRENALKLGAVVRLYAGLDGPRLALVRTLDAIGMNDDARQQLVDAVEAMPDEASLRLALIEHMLDAGVDVTEQLRAIGRIAQEGGLTISQRQTAARLFVAAGRDDEAIALLPDVAAEIADVSSLALLRRTGRLDAPALAALAASNDPRRIMFAAETYRLNGEPALAEDALIRLDGLVDEGTISKEIATQARATHLLQMGQTAQALSLAREVVEADPSQLGAWRLMVSATLVESGLAEAAEVADRAAASPAANDVGKQAAFTAFARATRRLSQALGTADQPGDDPAVSTQLPQVGGMLGELLTDEAMREADVSKALADSIVLLLDARKSNKPVKELVGDLTALAEEVRWSGTFQLLTAQVQLMAGDPVGAAERAQQQMRLRPRDPDPARVAVEALAAAGRNDDAIDAVSEWQRRLRLLDSDPALLVAADVTLARLYLRTNRAGQVLQVLRPHLGASGPIATEARALSAEAYLALGQSREALNLLRPMIDPSADPSQIPLARLWIAAARFSVINGEPGGVEALRYVTPDAERLQSAGWLSLMQLAEAWSFAHSKRSGGELAGQAGIDEQTERIIERTIEALKSDPNAAPLAWEQIGVVADQIGMHDDAEAAYRSALATDSTRVVAGNNLAMLLVRRVEIDGTGSNDPRLDVALALAQAVVANDAVRDTASYPALLDTLGAVQAARGDYAKALETLAEVVARAPQEQEWLLHTAEVQFASGDPAAAKRTWDQLDRLLLGGRPAPLLRERHQALADRLRESN